MGIPNRSSYAASKFAVQGYCEALRAEVATSGVSVHVASPGYIRTNLSRSAITGDGGKYGQMDKTTANGTCVCVIVSLSMDKLPHTTCCSFFFLFCAGADPNDVAVEVLQRVAQGKADFIVAATTSARAAIWLRFFFPSFLNSMLVKRYEKSQKEQE